MERRSSTDEADSRRGCSADIRTGLVLELESQLATNFPYVVSLINQVITA